MWIWPVYRAPNVPNSAASVSWEATFEGPSGLFRQFLYGVLGSSELSLCSGAHTLPSDRRMLPSLRGRLRPREGAGLLPVLLLEIWDSYPTDYLPLGRNTHRRTNGLVLGKGAHYLVSEATPNNHVLSLDLRDHLGH